MRKESVPSATCPAEPCDKGQHAVKGIRTTTSPPPPRRRSRAQRRMRWQLRWPRSAVRQGAIMKLGDNTAMQVDAISTGSLSADWRWAWAVCRAAISSRCSDRIPAVRPRWPSILAESAEKGGEVAAIDVEARLDPAYTSTLGEHRRAAGQPAGYPASRPWRSAGAGALQCHRRHRRGLRRCYLMHSCRNRGRDG